MWVEPGVSSAELKFGLRTTLRSFTPLTPNTLERLGHAALAVGGPDQRHPAAAGPDRLGEAARSERREQRQAGRHRGHEFAAVQIVRQADHALLRNGIADVWGQSTPDGGEGRGRRPSGPRRRLNNMVDRRTRSGGAAGGGESRTEVVSLAVMKREWRASLLRALLLVAPLSLAVSGCGSSTDPITTIPTPVEVTESYSGSVVGQGGVSYQRHRRQGRQRHADDGGDRAGFVGDRSGCRSAS